MAINKQSNIYTIIYIIVLVLIVGTGLAFTSLSLRERQNENISADKMKQILASVHVVPASDSVRQTYEKLIVEQFIVDSRGERVEGNAFDVDVAAQVKLKENERQLPVFVCRVPSDGQLKPTRPRYGAEVWGAVGADIALNSDGLTVYGPLAFPGDSLYSLPTIRTFFRVVHQVYI